jgi:hypothetical protein
MGEANGRAGKCWLRSVKDRMNSPKSGTLSLLLWVPTHIVVFDIVYLKGTGTS